jgi:hypothetical protein
LSRRWPPNDAQNGRGSDSLGRTDAAVRPRPLVHRRIQVRYVSAYVLNPEATKFLADRTGQSNSATDALFALAPSGPTTRKTFKPPEWLSWCLISVGAVLCLHSLAMPKPG